MHFHWHETTELPEKFDVMDAGLTVDEVIKELTPEPHPEGGHDYLFSAHGGGGVVLAYCGCGEFHHHYAGAPLELSLSEKGT